MIAELTSDQDQILASDDREVAISVRGVGKMYRIYERPQDRLKQMLFWRFGRSYGHEFWALRDISLDIRRGETVGIIGRNGSGKSTLLQIIAGTLAPTEGEVHVRGRVAALLELGSGFNPEFTGRENVFLNGAILGVSRAEMEARFDQIAAFADIGEFIEQPVKIYSSGMVVRLAFAVVSCIEPDILIVDEALAVGDIAFQARCLDKIKQLTRSGTTTLFVTHDTGTFQNLCDYGYLLDHGRLFAGGRPSQVAMQYYELIRETEHARQRLAASAPEHTEQVRAELAAKEEEIRGKSADNEYRFGTGAAKIVDYRILNSRGQEATALQVGEMCRYEVSVEFYDYVDNIALGVMFRNAQGQNLMGMHSFVENRVNFGPHDAGERITISCEQVMLLNPGEYLISLGLADCRSDYDFVSLDNRSSVTKVSVFGKPLGYGIIHTAPRFTLVEGLALRNSLQDTWQNMDWKDWSDWITERCQTLASEAEHVLEIGGVGKELAHFLAQKPRQLKTLNFPETDICRPTHYADNSFDLILSKMTFEHIYDPFAAAKEITRLLAPGGVLILATVWSWRYHAGPGFDDYWRFSVAGLRQLFHRLEILESGYDLADRRKDCRLDDVPIDDLGGWREHWYVFLVARKPKSDSALQSESYPYSYAMNLLDYTVENVKSTYTVVLDSVYLQAAIYKILSLTTSVVDQALIANGTDEERALPSEPHFVESGYSRMMLGRYAFAAAQFCRGANVLETCCGLGWGAYLTAQFARQVTAFDIDPALPSFCAQTWDTKNIDWQTGNALDLAFLGGARFDVALGMETIEHFSALDGAKYVAEVANILYPGGIFIGTSSFPETPEEARSLERSNAFHLYIYTREEMLKLLGKHFSRAVIIGNWMFIAVK